MRCFPVEARMSIWFKPITLDDARASYEAVATTPRPPTPPTTTGRPRSDGLSRCSTAA